MNKKDSFSIIDRNMEELINRLDSYDVYVIAENIGYIKNEYDNIIAKDTNQILEYQKVIDETINEKMNLEEKIKQALLILKNEDGTKPDYEIIEDVIECLESKGGYKNENN